MQKLNTTSVYILSILGFLCCCLGLGWILSLIGFLKANKDLKKANEDPDNYENINAMKTAKTIAIISLVISGLVGLWVLYTVIMILTNPDFACEFWNEAVRNVENNPGVQPEVVDMYREWRDEACSKL
ncbi:CCC motif membrane protein [Nonlabens sp.]|uniref:CCC motif membrane protein n=1 Tax=Nonlabens sp. TaxID=1888209 RepID=UPI003F69FECB